MDNKYKTIFYDKASIFIEGLGDNQKKKIAAETLVIENGDFQSVKIKTLKGKIKELIVGNSRITFFIHKNSIYFINGFIKKTNKTPKKEIEYAERVYKNFIKLIK